LQVRSLLSLLPDELVASSSAISLPEARRILSIAHRSGQLPTVTPAGIRRVAMQAARQAFPIPHLRTLRTLTSQIDPFVKFAFASDDDAVIESVRIPLERPGRYVVCVSSQIGCAIGCSFCGTGRMGLSRNLWDWEIIDQVSWVRAGLPKGARVHGVVLQGMGEPLANLPAVVRAVRVLCDPNALAIDARNITVCTAGVAHALPALFEALPNVRVAISIGSAISAKRCRLIPLESSQPLASVIEQLAQHARATRIAPMWAYTLLGGVNDTDEDLDAIATLARDFSQRSGVRPRLSLAKYNPVGGIDAYAPSTPERSEQFRTALGQLGIPVVRRYSGGSDIGAACGQLGLTLSDSAISPEQA
jgi:23S rRNA (adenine2503-C2)-methyltransferase